jgi:hypothetical protein
MRLAPVVTIALIVAGAALCAGCGNGMGISPASSAPAGNVAVAASPKQPSEAVAGRERQPEYVPNASPIGSTQWWQQRDQDKTGVP